MDKVKITQEQANAIKFARTEMLDTVIIQKHRSPKLWTGAYRPMNDMTDFQIINSLNGNFEVIS